MGNIFKSLTFDFLILNYRTESNTEELLRRHLNVSDGYDSHEMPPQLALFNMYPEFPVLAELKNKK